VNKKHPANRAERMKINEDKKNKASRRRNIERLPPELDEAIHAKPEGE
jgi:hypothetical protein